jgi:hypothetical protein
MVGEQFFHKRMFQWSNLDRLCVTQNNYEGPLPREKLFLSELMDP